MNRTLLAATLFVLFAGAAAAKDDNPPLLINIPCPAPAPAPACEPAPPACPPPAPVPACPPPPACPTPPPAPACPPAPPVCGVAPAVSVAPAAVVATKAPVVPQYKIVPVKKKVMEEEVYTVNETRTQVVDEVRSRTIKPPSPRLTRVIRTDGAKYAKHQRAPYTETYVQPVKTQFTVPVTKTRQVAKYVEEYKVVEERGIFRRR